MQVLIYYYKNLCQVSQKFLWFVSFQRKNKKEQKEDFIPAQECGIKSFLVCDWVISNKLNNNVYKWIYVKSIIEKELK